MRYPIIRGFPVPRSDGNIARGLEVSVMFDQMNFREAASSC